MALLISDKEGEENILKLNPTSRKQIKIALDNCFCLYIPLRAIQVNGFPSCMGLEIEPFIWQCCA
jgi:hypothetical protein